MLDKAKRFIQIIANIMFVIAIISLVLLLVLNTLEIVLRYGFKKSNVWSQEVSLLFICITIFFGFARVVVDNEDIAITFIQTKMSEKSKLVVQAIVQFFLAITTGYMFYHTVILLIVQQGQTTLIANIPNTYYSFPLALVLIVVFFHSVLLMIDSIKTRVSYNDTR